MNTLTATYRVVTPMFLGGAEPTAEAELRLPSFKGALRFWWRAIMWGKVKDVDELRRREAELFGSSENGQSRLILSMEKVRTFEDRPAGQWRANSWEQYTGYGLRDEVKGDRRFIPPGTTWVVRVRLRDYEPRHMDQVVAAMKLVGLVGGLGARSRNAWGSLTLLELEGRAVWKAPQDPSTLVSELEASIA
jgi:CRISPR-associated protein Cmr1